MIISSKSMYTVLEGISLESQLVFSGPDSLHSVKIMEISEEISSNQDIVSCIIWYESLINFTKKIIVLQQCDFAEFYGCYYFFDKISVKSTSFCCCYNKSYSLLISRRIHLRAIFFHSLSEYLWLMKVKMLDHSLLLF